MKIGAFEIILMGLLVISLLGFQIFSVIPGVPETSYSATEVMTDNCITVYANGATIAFNNLWYKNALQLNKRNGVELHEGKTIDDYELVENHYTLDSGCGDIIYASNAELKTGLTPEVQVVITLEKEFREANLPVCYSVYRAPGWSDGLNSVVSGYATWCLKQEQVEPVEEPEQPVEQPPVEQPPVEEQTNLMNELARLWWLFAIVVMVILIKIWI